VNQFNARESTISTIPHDIHRLRRKPENNFFSKRSIVAIEPLIHNGLDKLSLLLKVARETKAPLGVNAAFVAFSSDVVSEYAFGDSYDLLAIGKEVERERMSRALKSAGIASHTLKQWPWLVQFFDALPQSWISRLNPDFGLILGGQEVSSSHPRTFLVVH
jgi:hypothetical protein